jgi:hypothetical protein
MKQLGIRLLWVASGISVVFALGAYSKAVGPGERGSFVMYYPATGAAAGGPSPKKLTGVVTVKLDSQGAIKRAVQPGVIEVASHSVKNIGDTSRRIRFETAGLPADTELSSRDIAWNPETREIERDLAPGATVGIDALVRLPSPLPAVSVPVSGTISVVDSRSGKRLSTLAVRFQQDGFPEQTGGDCCAPK